MAPILTTILVGFAAKLGTRLVASAAQRLLGAISGGSESAKPGPSFETVLQERASPPPSAPRAPAVPDASGPVRRINAERLQTLALGTQSSAALHRHARGAIAAYRRVDVTRVP